MSTELLAMLGGGIAGFVMKYWAQRAADEQRTLDRLLSIVKSNTEAADAAVQRVSVEAGESIRRLIVLSVIFATVIGPFVAPLLGLPIFVEVTQENAPGFLGLTPGSSQTYFVQVLGVYQSATLMQCMLAIISFYFGSTVKPTRS